LLDYVDHVVVLDCYTDTGLLRTWFSYFNELESSSSYCSKV